MLLIFWCIVFIQFSTAIGLTISTVAGTGASAYSGDGGPATNAALLGLRHVWIDSLNRLYLSDYSACTIRVVSSTGIINVFAGVPTCSGNHSDNIAATSANAGVPYAIFGDTIGNVYYTDLNESIRMPTSQPTCQPSSTPTVLSNMWTVAGTGAQTYSGDEGLAYQASVLVTWVWVDSVNRLYISDIHDCRIRVISFTTGIITKFAGDDSCSGPTGDNITATSAYISPAAVFGDTYGNVYFTDSQGARVRKIDTTGIISTIAGSVSGYVDGDASSALFSNPFSLWMNSLGDFFVVDFGNNALRKITKSTNKVSTIVGGIGYGYNGENLAGTSTQLAQPYDVMGDTAGNVYIAQLTNRVSRLSVSTGNVTTFAGTGSAGLGELLTSPQYRARSSVGFAAFDPVTGKGYYWGSDSTSAPLSALINVTSIVASSNAFVATTKQGRVVAWGSSYAIDGWTSFTSSGQGGAYKGLQASEHAFAAIDGLWKVKSFGGDGYGGVVPDLVSQSLLSTAPLSLSSTAGAFCAVDSAGKVFVWGNAYSGGAVNGVNNADLTGVEKVFANRGAFVGVRSDGKAFAWGSCAYGGCQTNLPRLAHVVASRTAFVALTTDHEIISWGDAELGGDSSLVSKQLSSGVVRYISHTAGAFAAVKVDGSVVTWGSSSYGGDSSAVSGSLVGIVTVVASDRAFAAVTSKGKVVVWGDSKYGGSFSSAAQARSLSANVTSVVATKAAFAALKKDGSVWAWGNSNYGGSIDDNIRTLLSNGTMVLQGNDVAFLAINSQGRVMGWGNKAVFNEAGVVGSIPITSTNRLKFA
eukprot:gene8578-9281_t